MSLASLKGNASGTGTVTLESPNTNTDRTISLPDATCNMAYEDSSGNLQVNSGYGSKATAYGCRAWVQFDGTGTPAIRGSGNISSITDNGTGRMQCNFTTAMTDTNYCTNITGDHVVGIYYMNGATTRIGAYATTYVEANFFNNSSNLQDPTIACVAVFR